MNEKEWNLALQLIWSQNKYVWKEDLTTDKAGIKPDYAGMSLVLKVLSFIYLFQRKL